MEQLQEAARKPQSVYVTNIAAILICGSVSANNTMGVLLLLFPGDVKYFLALGESEKKRQLVV